MWYRVFGRSLQEVSPVALAEYLHSRGLAVEPHFRGDEYGWTQGELRLAEGRTPIYLSRYLTTVDNIRHDLNAYAAELETCDYHPHHQQLMEHVIQTQQLIVLRRPADARDEATVLEILEQTCGFLAAATDGVYQVDGRGWFAANGELLLPEY
jgi:hypothetical protein